MSISGDKNGNEREEERENDLFDLPLRSRIDKKVRAFFILPLRLTF